MVVRCPACSHAQIEPKLAISTRCRGCGAYIEFQKKKPVIRDAPTGPRVTQSIAGKGAEPVATPPPTQKLPSLQLHASPPTAGKVAPPPAPIPFSDLGAQTNVPASQAPQASPAPTWAPPSAPLPAESAEEPVTTEPDLALPPLESIAEDPSPIEETQIEETPAATAPAAPLPEALPAIASVLAPLSDAGATPQIPVTPEPAASPSPQNEAAELPDEPAPSRYSAPAPPPQTSTAPGLFQRLLKKDPERRDVVCPACGHQSQAPFAAFATNCPKCGVYIPLKDYEVQERWNARIETRGNVAVTKKGHFGGPAIICNNLKLDGPCNGDISCSGDLIVRAKLELPGKIQCDRCIVEKGAKVKFLQTIYAREVIIAGDAKANVDVKGTFTLEKSGSLQGDVVAASLAIRPGGKHQGSIRTRSA